jgi:hypothetical protein
MTKNIILFLLAISFISFNQEIKAQKTKVVDASIKKKPKWVNGLEQGFIIVTASSSTLDDAQQKALAKVKERIISSVAENIQTSSEYFRSEHIKNNSSEFAESLETATKTQAANIPFIKGISLSKVSEYYWEKIELDKKAKKYKYYYHIKYPFSRTQLLSLIREFEKADKALTTQLNDLLNKIDNLVNVEEMSQTVNELQALSESFIDVDPRKKQAFVGISKLKEMLKNISIETVNNTLGEIRVVLKLGDKTVITSRKPKVKSNCARITSVENKKPEWRIKYSYEECYDDPDNVVSVEFKNAYGKAKNDYQFNINADKIDIFVNNDINLSGGSVSDSIVSGATCHISITSKYESAFSIKKVILNFGKESPIIIDNIDKTFQGKGKHDIDFVINKDFKTNVYSAKKYPMIKGSIEYKSVKTGEQSIYKMYNQKITTDW